MWEYNPTVNKKLANSILLLLKPLVALMNRNGVAFGDFAKLAKQAYIQETERELLSSGEKATTSKIAIITGLTRKDVSFLRKETFPTFEQSHQKNRAVRVISGWISDTEFCDEEGNANELNIRGEKATFEALVNRYSGDIPFPSMLKELERIKTVEKTDDDKVVLLRAAYISSHDDEDKYDNLGQDVHLLLSTIKHNILADGEPLRYQRKVCYDKVPEEFVDEFRKMASKGSQSLLVKLNKWLAKHDVDRNPDLKAKDLKKVGLGLYYFEEPTEIIEDKKNDS